MENKKVKDILKDNKVVRIKSYDDVIIHFNPYHDALGRFSSKISGGFASITSSKKSSGKKKSTESPKIDKNTASTKVKDINKKSRSQKSIEAKQEIQAKKVSELKTARQRSEEINRLIKSGTATELYNNRDSLSRDQMQQAINRINTEKTLRELMIAENPSKLKQITKKLDVANEYAKKGIDYTRTIKSLKKEFGVDKEKAKNEKKKKEQQERWEAVSNPDRYDEVFRNADKYSSKELSEANNKQNQIRQYTSNAAKKKKAEENAKQKEKHKK